MRSSCTRAGLKKEILTPKIQVERISLERQRGGTGRGGGGGGGPDIFHLRGGGGGGGGGEEGTGYFSIAG